MYMGDQIFRDGGRHHIKRVGHDEYSMTVTIPKDENGRVDAHSKMKCGAMCSAHTVG